MSEYNFAHLIAKPKPLDHLIIPPIENEEARAVLLKHGCRIQETERLPHCILYFPEGTTQTEIFLRLTHPRYRITLPDGFELRETYDRYQSISILSYTAEQPERET
jgi:hypothetical protein